MLSALKADDSDKLLGHTNEESEDEDAATHVQRRMSMNQYNEVGMDFHKY